MAKDYSNAPVTPGSVTDAYEKTLSNTLQKNEYQSNKCCRPTMVGITCIAVGVVAAIAGVVYSTAIPSVINTKVDNGVALCKESEYEKDSFLDSYGDCEDCAPYYYNYHLFNVTNADAYLKGEKLKVQEIGPYAYRKFSIKKNVQFDENTVTYQSYSKWEFDAEKSCEGCKETDIATGFDAGFMSLLGGRGGETGLVLALLRADDPTDPTVLASVKSDGPKLLKFWYGLNSLDPETMKPLVEGATAPIQSALFGSTTGLDGYEKKEGVNYSGLLVKRTIRQWALGYPSLMVGTIINAAYSLSCTEELVKKCNACTGAAECAKVSPDCGTCKLGAKIRKINAITCPQVEAIYSAKYGAAAAKKFVDLTCKKCDAPLGGICAAPLPGAIEGSGLDWSKNEPSDEFLYTTKQKTGCDDKAVIGDYLMYENIVSNPLFAKLDKKRNPTVSEIVSFKNYADCNKPTANLTCTPVQGGDGTSTKPAGVGMGGLADEVVFDSRDLYVSPALQNVTLFDSKEKVEFKGISLNRFRPPTDLLSAKPWSEPKGTGVPVDGVQNLAFAKGFLAYVSYPMYLWGDKSLTENVEITMLGGIKANKANLYDGEKLKEEHMERLSTYIDIEPTTGKTMHAYKRLQASYALNKSPFSPTKSLTDITHPAIKPEVVYPIYWGEETAEVPDKKAEAFGSIGSLAGSFLPVFIVLLVLGIGLAAFGVFYYLRAKKASKNSVV
jgi:hypothetical protein